MEEDIKILEELIIYWEQLIYGISIDSSLYKWYKDNNMEKRKQALKNLIQRNKELEETYEHIKFVRGSLPKDTLMIAMCNEDFCRNFGEDYISKSKIKAKIEELKNQMLNEEDLYQFNTKRYCYEALKKLIED